jgi:hypothetical protein
MCIFLRSFLFSVKKLLLFFAFFQFFSAFSMKNPHQENDDDGWVLIKTKSTKRPHPSKSSQSINDMNIQMLQQFIQTLSEDNNTLKAQILELEQTCATILRWAVNHGSPKPIKILLKKNKEQCSRKLVKSRKKFQARHQEYSFETAISTGNLNYIKNSIALHSNNGINNNDNFFNEMAFFLAAVNRSKKTVAYLAQNKRIFTDPHSLIHLYTLFSKAAEDQALGIITILFKSNLDLKIKQWKRLIAFGLEKFENQRFVQGITYLKNIMENLKNLENNNQERATHNNETAQKDQRSTSFFI